MVTKKNEPPPEEIYKRCVARTRGTGKLAFPLTPLTDAAWIKDKLYDRADGKRIVAVVVGRYDDVRGAERERVKRKTPKYMGLADLVQRDDAGHENAQQLRRQMGAEADRRILDMHEVRAQRSDSPLDAADIRHPPVLIVDDLGPDTLPAQRFGQTAGITAHAAHVRGVRSGDKGDLHGSIP